ncbi:MULTISPECIES: hypothetical protein [Pseudomonas]|uniref:Lipoprotein n=1 Tax=Pseudomonas fluorescens TaxID=294 RepID=A0A0N7H1I2_PSEFL|nr:MULTISPECIES: hypothetical protein [Pseudomonas]ALI06012.1 hypothetical protein AO356_04165 [Pseudomonas fluorescens]
MRYFYLGIFFSLAMLLSACNTTPYGKATIYYDREQFPAQLVKDFPELTDPILQHGRCSLIISTPGSNTGAYYFCTYALTANTLYIQEWDAKALKYVEIVHVGISKFQKVALHTFFRTKQLQLTEERRQLALSVTTDGGEFINGAATESLFEAIKSKGVPVADSEGLINSPRSASPVVIPVFIKKYR